MKNPELLLESLNLIPGEYDEIDDTTYIGIYSHYLIFLKNTLRVNTDSNKYYSDYTRKINGRLYSVPSSKEFDFIYTVLKNNQISGGFSSVLNRPKADFLLLEHIVVRNDYRHPIFLKLLIYRKYY